MLYHVEYWREDFTAPACKWGEDSRSEVSGGVHGVAWVKSHRESNNQNHEADSEGFKPTWDWIVIWVHNGKYTHNQCCCANHLHKTNRTLYQKAILGNWNRFKGLLETSIVHLYSQFFFFAPMAYILTSVYSITVGVAHYFCEIMKFSLKFLENQTSYLIEEAVDQAEMLRWIRGKYSSRSIFPQHNQTALPILPKRICNCTKWNEFETMVGGVDWLSSGRATKSYKLHCPNMMRGKKDNVIVYRNIYRHFLRSPWCPVGFLVLWTNGKPSIWENSFPYAIPWTLTHQNTSRIWSQSQGMHPQSEIRSTQGTSSTVPYPGGKGRRSQPGSGGHL